MEDALSPDARSLAERAEEILRRADLQAAQLGASAPGTPRLPPVVAPGPGGRPVDLGELLDFVAAGTRAVRGQLETLHAALERIAAELGRPIEPAPVAAAPAPAPEMEPQDEDVPPAVAPPPPPPPSGAADDAARLIAMELAASGGTRESVGRRLRQEFGIADPTRILEDTFGPGAGGSSGRRPYGG